jgi:glycosyltransferase involved in cell wall biosynthesis
MQSVAPLVSVIVPNYNHAPYLHQRIESIINQTYQNLEVIVLDDCSTDESKLVIENYRDNPRVKQIEYNEINSGSTFKQWDKGIRLAKGEYIWIAESDDWCEPFFIDTLLSEFIKQPSIVLGYVQSYYMTGENDIKWISKQNYLEKILNGTDFIKEKLLTGNSIFNASMAIFKKSTYDNILPKFTTYKYCGDWHFWADIARQGDVFISGKILNYFRKHEADVSSKACLTGLDFIEELNVLFYFLDSNFISEIDFLNALILKYIRYRYAKVHFTDEIAEKIDSLFYFNHRTVKYKKILKKNFRKVYIERKLKLQFKKIIPWEREFR